MMSARQSPKFWLPSPPGRGVGGERSRSEAVGFGRAKLLLSRIARVTFTLGCGSAGASPSRLIWAVLFLLASPFLCADEPKKPDLSLEQQQLRRDYERFERSLLEASEHLRRKEPEQADILDRARERSQEQALLNEMEKIASELKSNKTGSASDRQREVIDRMKEILQLLQSEDERDRLQREMERIQDLLKDTNRVIGKQRDAKAANQKGGDLQKAQDEQKKASDEANKLAQKIDKQDKSRQGDSKPGDNKPQKSGEPQGGENSPMPDDSKPGEEKPGEKKPDDKQPENGDKPKDPMKPGDSKPGEQKPGEQKPTDSPSKPGDSKPKPMPGQKSPPMPGQSSPPMPGSPMPPMPGQPQQPQPPQDQQPQEQQPQEQQTEGREELKEAQESMQKAIEELEQKARETAGKEQERALAELEKLKAKLEEILRQMREEEKELYLTMLEVRFQKMLKLQLQINAETTRLDKIPEPERNPAHFDKCSEAGRLQRENLTEADKTLVLLKEEGSSVAFPEAVEQMRGNMDAVAQRLAKADTAKTTQLLEQIVVETLEEIILAMQKEMEAQRQKKQQQQQKKQQGSPQDQKLVNQIAELKMIRSLQNQINRITKQIGLEIDGEQTADADQRKLVEDLAKRQQKIQSATYDLSTGRNE